MPGAFYIGGGCQCCSSSPPPCTPPTILGNVQGCNGLTQAGITVEAHDSTAGGTLLGTTTTNAGGNYTLALTSATAGNDIVIVPAPVGRFDPSNNITLTYTPGFPFGNKWGCGWFTFGINFTLTAASGYTCIGGCFYPVKNTLTLTDSVYGGATIVNSGSGWVGSTSATFGGSAAPPCNNTCIGIGTTIFYEWDGGSLASDFFVGCYINAIGCPGPFVNTLAANPSTAPSITCPLSFSFTLTQTGGTSAWNLATVNNLYTCSTVTFTISE